jgi:hypothetical protein
MDFVSRQAALKKDTKDGRRYAEIFQQLGLAWVSDASTVRGGEKSAAASAPAKFADTFATPLIQNDREAEKIGFPFRVSPVEFS